MNRVLVPQIAAPPAAPRHALPVELRGETMGTNWTLRAFAPPGFNADRLNSDIQALFAGIIAQMSPWVADSGINRFNNLTAGGWFDLPEHFAAVIDGALAVAERSNGAFDPSLGALVDLSGFGAQPLAHETPSAEVLHEALICAGWRKLERDGARLRQPGGLRLDLNGVAKGYAVDQAIAIAKRASLPACLIEIGGELSGYGVKPDGQPWWVELERPDGANTARTLAALFDLSIATSGDYRRYVFVDEVRISHTLSPATGRPLVNNVASVSVLHASCMQADAYATALQVLGPIEGMALADALGLAALMTVRDGPLLTEHISRAAVDLMA